MDGAGLGNALKWKGVGIRFPDSLVHRDLAGIPGLPETPLVRNARGFSNQGLADFSGYWATPREGPGVGFVQGISRMTDSAHREGQLSMALSGLCRPIPGSLSTRTGQCGLHCPKASRS